jgi:hypothetical protein
VSRYHAFLYQSFAWQSDGQERLSHEGRLLAFRNGKVARIFQILGGSHKNSDPDLKAKTPSASARPHDRPSLP